ncbi:MAG TPA: deoxyribose-phosphate aldolase [Dactylosporangium sp.]|nr:deoxyribose-phosphate aldolase [Dactylosporangium sp.]
MFSVRQVAKMIDHSLLRPELTRADVAAGCELAAEYDVASVCVKPCDVAFAVGLLAGTDVAVGTVAGFPHGAHVTRVKTAETAAAREDGAAEIDVVLNIGRLREGRDDEVRDDLAAVVDAAGGALVKVILENAYLTDDEKRRGCRLAEAAGAGYVKTSTGFAHTGATIEDVRLMRAAVSPHIGVKAAGGVRTLDLLLSMVDAGATRFGATTTAAMLDELAARRRD